jgi:hypothetical protein
MNTVSVSLSGVASRVPYGVIRPWQLVPGAVVIKDNRGLDTDSKHAYLLDKCSEGVGTDKQTWLAWEYTVTKPGSLKKATPAEATRQKAYKSTIAFHFKTTRDPTGCLDTMDFYRSLAHQPTVSEDELTLSYFPKKIKKHR